MVISRYPHIGLIHWKDAGSQDENLKWIDGQTHDMEIRCRVEFVGKGRYAAANGDVQLTYGYKVRCKKIEPEIPGTAHFIYNGVNFPIVSVGNFQLHTVLWL